MNQSDCILAIDTATGPCSVAVWKAGKTAAYAKTKDFSAQSAVLVPMIERALADCGMQYKDLTAVACTVGPGSFTGIRVGLATARGICFAGGIKGLGFTTLEVLAHAAGASESHPVEAILAAGKGEFYYQKFASCALNEPSLSRLETIDSALLVPPRADALAELAALHQDRALPLKPFYIRPPDAKTIAERMAATGNR